MTEKLTVEFIVSLVESRLNTKELFYEIREIRG